MGMQWMVEDKRKSLEKIKYKFKLVYLLGIKIPLSLWFLMIGFEPEAMFLTSILELTLFSVLARFLFSTDPGYVSKETPVVPVGGSKLLPGRLWASLPRRRGRSAGQQKLRPSMLETYQMEAVPSADHPADC